VRKRRAEVSSTVQAESLSASVKRATRALHQKGPLHATQNPCIGSVAAVANTQNALSCCVGRQAVPVHEISRLGQNRRSQEERVTLFAKAVTKYHTSLDSKCSRGTYRCTDRVETNRTRQLNKTSLRFVLQNRKFHTVTYRVRIHLGQLVTSKLHREGEADAISSATAQACRHRDACACFVHIH